MEQPISLYLDLVPGSHPDLEVASRANIAFAQVVKELAFHLDPFAEVRLEFESGTEGSLSLNALIKFITGKVPSPAVRGAIVGAAALFFLQEVSSAVIALVIAEAVGPDPEVSQQDIDRLAEACMRLAADGIAIKHVQDVYREIERDEKIEGVGIATGKSTRPRSIVPRSEFRERSGYVSSEAITTSRRSNEDRTSLTLVGPVLQFDQRKRKWRFLSEQGPLNASVKDTDFLRGVLSGRHSIPMVAGIQMDVLLQTVEVLRDGLWQVAERNIIRVYDTQRNMGQYDLFADEGESENDGDQ